jgi:hypothetical protein
MHHLIRDRHVLKAKVSEFDRLAQNRAEPFIKHRTMEREIDYFKRQEEIQFAHDPKQSLEIARKVRLHGP